MTGAVIRSLELRGYTVLPLCALIASILYQSVIAWGDVERLLVHMSVDDTFLYLQVARNWALMGFPTFDGHNPTNGFQFLWAVTVCALSAFIADKLVLLRVVLSLGALLNLGTGLLLFKIANRIFGSNSGVLAVLLWSIYMSTPGSTSASLSGMESELHGLVFAGLLLLFFDCQGPSVVSTRRLVFFSLLLTLNVLCRLEAGLISALFGIVVVRDLVRRNARTHLAVLCLVPILLLGMWLAVNWAYTGSAIPVSGKTKLFYAQEVQAKSAVVAVRFALGQTASLIKKVLNQQSHGMWIVSAVCIVAGLARLRGTVPYWFAVTVIVGVLGHALAVHVTLQDFAYAPWYYKPLRVSAALLVAGALHVLIGRRRSWVILASVGLLFLGAQQEFHATVSAPIDPKHPYVVRYRAARWLETTDKLDRSYAIGAWNAGQLAYFVDGLRVVNLDGLVQGTDYIDRVLRPNAWKAYFRREGIRYLVDYNVSFFDRVAMTRSQKEPWDAALMFRGVVAFDKVRTVQTFGPLAGFAGGDLYVLDISEWLEGQGEGR